MSRINKTQKYAILWLHSQGWDRNQIISELELTDSQIKNVLKANQSSDNRLNNKIETGSSVVAKLPNSKNLMITESQSGMHKVSVMTKAASEINDENKKQIVSRSTKDLSKYIHKPNG
jgi:hypothetical protein